MHQNYRFWALQKEQHLVLPEQGAGVYGILRKTGCCHATFLQSRQALYLTQFQVIKSAKAVGARSVHANLEQLSVAANIDGQVARRDISM